jgi:hypothetical protein
VDETGKKPTNTSSGASAITLMPAQRAGNLRSVRSDLKWHVQASAENCDQFTLQVKFQPASRVHTLSLTNSCIPINLPSNPTSPNDCFHPVGPLVRHRLGVGTSTTVTLTFSVPLMVTRFSVTESGNMQDGPGNTYTHSMAQMVTP